MIWAVKILALNKKDGKGNDLNFPTKKSFLTKIWPNARKITISLVQGSTILNKIPGVEME
jgi:hypothetical protein